MQRENERIAVAAAAIAAELLCSSTQTKTSVISFGWFVLRIDLHFGLCDGIIRWILSLKAFA